MTLEGAPPTTVNWYATLFFTLVIVINIFYQMIRDPFVLYRK